MRQLINKKIITIIFILLSHSVWAESNIHIMNAWINDAPPTLKHRAGYIEVHNMSDTDIILQSASSDAFKTVEFHESILNGEQVQMRQRKNIKIDAGKTIQFQPGGLHLMLMNKQQDLKENDTANVSLTLSNGETIDITFTVKKAKTDSLHNHEHHHH